MLSLNQKYQKRNRQQDIDSIHFLLKSYNIQVRSRNLIFTKSLIFDKMSVKFYKKENIH